MENVVHTLVTLLAALLVATGAPVKGGELPDRPAIVEQSPQPVSDPIGVTDARGASQNLGRSEYNTEIDREQAIDAKPDIQTKDAGSEANVELKVQAPKADDLSTRGAGDTEVKAKDKATVADKELGSLETSTDYSSQDVKPVWDAKDQGLTKGQQKVADGQSNTQTIKPEDSKSPEHPATLIEPSDKSSQHQVESKPDSSKSNYSKDSHTETKSSSSPDSHPETKSSEDQKSQDSHD